MESNIKYGKMVYQFNHKEFIIVEVVINGKACYCIHNLKTNKKVIFDRNDEVLAGVKNLKRIYDNWTIVYAGRRDRSLQAYLFYLYHGVAVSDYCHYTRLKDKSMMSMGVIDLRKDNIIPTKNYAPNRIKVWKRPGNPEEKYLAITSRGVTEVFNYSDSIMQIFKDRINLIVPEQDKKYKRLKFRKTRAEKSVNLSRFILQKYVGNIPNTSHCGHTHSGYRWINCPENIMEMVKQTNDAMTDLASRIGGGYDMNAVVYRDGHVEKILIDFNALGIHGYVVCNTPELYLSFQNCIFGKMKLTEQVKIFADREQIDTPAQAFERNRIKNNHLENQKAALWEWCKHRDILLWKYHNNPEEFFEWPEGTENGVAMGLLMEYLGKSNKIFYNITPCCNNESAK